MTNEERQKEYDFMYAMMVDKYGPEQADVAAKAWAEQVAKTFPQPDPLR